MSNRAITPYHDISERSFSGCRTELQKVQVESQAVLKVKPTPTLVTLKWSPPGKLAGAPGSVWHAPTEKEVGAGTCELPMLQAESVKKARMFLCSLARVGIVGLAKAQMLPAPDPKTKTVPLGASSGDKAEEEEAHEARHRGEGLN